MKRVVYLVTSALVAMLILVPSALAQDVASPGDTEVCSPEPNAVVVDEDTLQQITGEPLPSQGPTSEPVPVSDQPSTCAPLPGTGGPEIVGSALSMALSASALLLLVGLGGLAYGVLRCR